VFGRFTGQIEDQNPEAALVGSTNRYEALGWCLRRLIAAKNFSTHNNTYAPVFGAFAVFGNMLQSPAIDRANCNGGVTRRVLSPYTALSFYRFGVSPLSKIMPPTPFDSSYAA